MTLGLNGKVMTYDGENRPLSVTAANGDVTSYTYAPSGSRLTRSVTSGGTTATSLYLGDVEIIDPGPGEVVHRYIDSHLREKLEQGQAPEISYFYRDQLESLQLIADELGGEDLERVYQPFGESGWMNIDSSGS